MKKFPLFIDISGKKIVVYGAGAIASRRVETLLDFGPKITVYSPAARPGILTAARDGKLGYVCQEYRPGGIPEDAFLVLAATSDGEVNRRIWQECHEKQIPVNVCSDKNLCDFQFPGIVSEKDLVIGINAGGSDHRLAKEWTGRIREMFSNGAQVFHENK